MFVPVFQLTSCAFHPLSSNVAANCYPAADLGTREHRRSTETATVSL
jgi:hypothetical protein